MASTTTAVVAGGTGSTPRASQGRSILTRRRAKLVKTVILRVLRMLAVLWVVSIATFSLILLLPGDPVRLILGQQATDDQVAYLTKELGLDRPIHERYFEWISGVMHLDFGQTLVPPVQPVSSVLADALPITLQLAVMAIVMGLAAGIVLGCVAAYRPGGRLDSAINSGSFALISIPAFVMALLLIRLFVFNADLVRNAALALGVLGAAWLAVLKVVKVARGDAAPKSIAISAWPVAIGGLIFLLLPDFPREGWVAVTADPGKNLLHAALPAVTLAMSLAPLYAQLLRADMIQTLRQSFVTVARAKGMTPRHVVIKEALRPSLFPLVTVAGLSFGNLIGGSVVVESIFGLPGLGRLLVNSIQAKDYAVVQAAVLVAAALFLLLNALVDITYSILDPRLRRAGR